jgi:hypothetical protein
MLTNNHSDAMLRQTRAHHVQLSSMADVKASMLITMASIVLTLAASNTIHVGPQWPLLVLMGFCLTTILLAAFAAMPKVRFRKRPPTPEERADAHFNVLFFGDFNGLSYEEFEAEMVPVLNDPSLCYEAQVREIYSLGVYLAKRKYRFLRLAYMAFMAGIVASAIMLVVAGYY